MKSRTAAIIMTLVLWSITMAIANTARFRGGTTQVLLASELAVAIASDSLQHESNTGAFKETKQKVTHVGENVLLATSGICAVSDGNGRVTFDLQLLAPRFVRKLKWANVESDLRHLAKELQYEIKALESTRFQGLPDETLKPNITVLIGGKDGSGKIFAGRILYSGSYQTDGTSHTAKFGEPKVEAFPVRPGKFIVVVETRLQALENRARDICAGRDPRISKYPGVLRLYQRNASADDKDLRGAAIDLVQFTIDHDNHIGGPIDALTVSKRGR